MNKPWTEGRIYTEEQRAKKNAYNRALYQRTKKERSAKIKEWEALNKDLVQERRRNYNLKNKYKLEMKRIERVFGLSEIDYINLINTQNNHCYICGKEDGRLHIDHDHATGKVRKLLCSSCNQGLGYFKDSTELLQKAALYIEEHSNDSVE